MSNFLHKDLATGKWFTLSLMEQLGNIGSEVGRTAQWKGENEARFQGAFYRALDLFDLTLSDERWRGRRFELARARELFCAAALDAPEARLYNTSLKDLNNYFLPFAIAARSAA